MNNFKDIVRSDKLIVLISLIGSIAALVSFFPIVAEKTNLSRIFIAILLGTLATAVASLITKLLLTKRNGKIFFIYSQHDHSFVKKLKDDLDKERFDVTFDREVVKVGDNINLIITEQINNSDIIIFVNSDNIQNSSKQVHSELDFAIQKNKKIVPVIIDENIDLPPELIELKFADFSHDYFRAFKELKSGLIKQGSTAHNNI